MSAVTKAAPSHGKLDIKFRNVRGKTSLVDCYQQPPLKASRALYIEGTRKATVYLMESSGGLVAGDRNDFTVELEENTEVVLKPQSATKVYPAFNNQPSEQTITIHIGENSHLEWNRDEIIPFERAKFNGKSRVQMTNSSSLLWNEIIYSGREKRGEKFAFQECNTHLEVWMEAECVVYDSLKLHPKEQELQQLSVLEDFNYIGNLWFICSEASKVDSTEFQKLLVQTENHKSGISTLDGKGILVRWLSNNLPLIKREMETLDMHLLTK
ncbi:urease accessory protein UreD [Aquibacillus salsiterrae]|uniref:Urease accessory protein UreD n=1 Tax=Aquibacillus salsiterrae TaxID=2950439 RepID=A0A9X3WAS5_9BACI|nr:urease accessory protein UreD [Aquibacillus salsiterrae]MDC3415895.1 urease accessory protein UreD [Aquibacillus salsiterrae]